MVRWATVAVLCVAATACSAEKRAIGPQAPLTPPTSASDPRAEVIAGNAFQVSEGGRLFCWHGCGECHTETSGAAANLTRRERRHGGSMVQLYASIADGRGAGMPAYRDTITSQQIWQLAAYVSSLPKTPDHKRRRASSEQQGEPQGDSWAGPLS